MINLNYPDLIKELKKDKDVLILSHYYVHGAVQDIADYVGDSYYLSQMALQSKAQTILFCGVKFMAESAKILSPSKTVLMPDEEADCPMAHMITPHEIEQVRKQYHDLAVVCYINSTSEIKALSDVCVTSANAVTIVRNLKQKNIFFVPDKNLGKYVQSQVPDKNFIFNNGFCCVHANITKEDLAKTLRDVPNAEIVAHPECTPDVLEMATFIGSTSNILDYVSRSTHTEFIICTEVGIFHQLIKNNPGKRFYISSDRQLCANMKKITLENVYKALVTLTPEINLDKDIIKKAKGSLQMMHTLA
ncbi:MAG TPA: quinolinate synthase NadA [Epulopiscium sp.]|nr:quinolinate synthase NadA [Candidatus Epulonipiscium sp.]